MRHVLIVFALTLAFLVTDPVRADDRAAGIQATIKAQIEDFQRSDITAAFQHATPSIQGKFGSPETFGRMVRQAYPMVWRPARWEMRQIVETDYGPVQVVLFEDQSGRLHEAGYLMEQIEGVWRIDGVRLRAVPGVGT
ncbi:MAG: DUF4864 domain-containing protein [Pseudomonadota bacterium]